MFWATVALLLFFHVNGAWCCAEGERDSLLQFKASVLDPSNTLLNSWLGFNCCDWHGIQCNPPTHHVIRLDLHRSEDAYGMYLSNQTGDVLSPLFNLEHLQHLDLSLNHFYGVSIPPGLGRLKSLRYLDLSDAGFSGDIPRELGNMSSLRYLDLSFNGGLRMEEIQTWRGNMRNLRELILDEVNMSRVMERNHELDNALSTMYSLTRLQMSGCYLSGTIPPSLAKLTNLTYLDLKGSDFNGSIPSALLSLPRLQQVDLSYNNLTGKIPACYENSSIEILNLENNYLNGELTEEFANMPSLKTLKLGGNRLNSNIPTSLAKCKELEIIDMNNNKMTGLIPKWIGQLSSLKILILRLNRFEGRIPSELTKLPLLQILDLSSNRFSGVIPVNISSLQALKNKTVRTDVFGAVRDGNVSSANPFYVDGVTINNKAQPMVFARSLALVKCIDLSNNNIEGEIPPDIGLLEGLVILNVSRNNIIGEITKSLGEIVMLESLDLSHNLLSGNIPLELQSLTFLGYLDLSHNNLSGSIPQGGHLLTFEASSFSNNSDLCGLQVNKTCSHNHPCPPSIPPEIKDNKIDEGDDIWWGVGLGLSYAVGFSIVIGILCLTTTWSIKCLSIMDNIIIYLFKRFKT